MRAEARNQAPMERPQSSSAPRRWRRIIPVALAMYTIAYIDRTNISLALPYMSPDLHMGPEESGSAAGVFFWGYLFLQIPGGYLAERWSAKKVVSILLVLWGVCAAGSGLVTSSRQFWMMRFLLGITEGGVFPATIILLANWFRPAERARANAYWMLCQPLAIVISSPLSGWILGHWNWRVLLVAEGALPFVWLVVWSIAIDDRPATARWLSPREREYLLEALPPMPSAKSENRLRPIVRSLGDFPTWTLVALYFFLNCGGYGYLFWLPSALLAVKRLPSFWLGILFAIPYLLAGAGMVVNSRHSDATQERHLHVAVPLLLSGALMFGSVLAGNSSPLVSYPLICLAGANLYSSLGPFWAIPTESLATRSAGVSAGLVNALGALGGFFGPLVVGVLRGRTGDFRMAFVALSASLLLAGMLAFMLKLTNGSRREQRLSGT